MTKKKAKRRKSYTVRTTVEVVYEIELQVLAHTEEEAESLAMSKAEAMAFDPALQDGDFININATPEEAWETKKGRIMYLT